MREVPLEEIDGVRKEKERLTAAWFLVSHVNQWILWPLNTFMTVISIGLKVLPDSNAMLRPRNGKSLIC